MEFCSEVTFEVPSFAELYKSNKWAARLGHAVSTFASFSGQAEKCLMRTVKETTGAGISSGDWRAAFCKETLRFRLCFQKGFTQILVDPYLVSKNISTRVKQEYLLRQIL